MTYVFKQNDTWVPWRGERLDGIAYPRNIVDLWSDEELAAIGLVKPMPFEAPEGKRAKRDGKVSYEGRPDGTVIEIHKVEDIPPPPPELTPSEKVARLAGEYGLTVSELSAALSAVPVV